MMGGTMDWVARLGWMGIVGGLAMGCTPPTKGVGQIGGSDDDEGDAGSSTEAPESMTGQSPTGGGTDTEPDDETGVWGGTMSDETGTFPGTGGTGPDTDDGPTGETGTEACEKEDWPACPYEGDCIYS